MSQGDVEAGKAYVRVTANDQAALKAVDRFAGRFKAMGKTVASVGSRIGGSVAAGVGAVASSLGIQRVAADAVALGLIGTAVAWSNAAGAADDMAKRIGIDVEALQGLGYATEQAGGTVEDLEKGLGKMQRTIGEAGVGSKSAAAAIGSIGLSVDELAGKAPEEQFRLIADKLAGIEDPAERAAAGARIFGKGAGVLMPLLKEGRKGIDQLVARADHLGLIMKGKDVTAAESFGDALLDMRKTLMANVYTIGASLVPMLRGAVDWLTNAAASVRHFINENRAIAQTVFIVAASLTGAAAGLWAFGGLLGGVGKALSLIGPILAIVKMGVLAIGAAFSFLVSPVGLAIAAVTALGAYLVTTTAEGGAVLDWLVGKFRQLAADAVEAWGGISAALAAGDLGLAAKIAFSFVSLEASKAYKAVWEVWYGFRNWFVGLFSEAWYGAVVAAANAIAKLETWWAESVGFFGNIWDRFTNTFRQAWNNATGWIRKQWSKVMSLISDDVDVEAEIKRIDEETAAANKASQDKTDASIAARDQRKNDRLAEIERDRSDAEAGAVQLADEGLANRKAQADAEIAAMQSGIDKSRADYQALLKDAQDKKAAADAKQSPEVKRPDPNKLGDLMAAKKQEPAAMVSYNAGAAVGLASAKPLDRIAKAAEDTAGGVQQLVRQGNNAEVYGD